MGADFLQELIRRLHREPRVLAAWVAEEKSGDGAVARVVLHVAARGDLAGALGAWGDHLKGCIYSGPEPGGWCLISAEGVEWLLRLHGPGFTPAAGRLTAVFDRRPGLSDGAPEAVGAEGSQRAGPGDDAGLAESAKPSMGAAREEGTCPGPGAVPGETAGADGGSDPIQGVLTGEEPGASSSAAVTLPSLIGDFWRDLYRAARAIRQGRALTAHRWLFACGGRLIDVYRLALAPNAAGAGWEGADGVPGMMQALEPVRPALSAPLDPRAQRTAARRMAEAFEGLVLPLCQRLGLAYPMALRTLVFQQLDTAATGTTEPTG